ncbi:MAG: N-acetylmuramoyl-L-alanine amidase [Candidatus Paceibacterota bacterium]|jgi:N-acetylmuramoyl-L-alanine amidase
MKKSLLILFLLFVAFSWPVFQVKAAETAAPVKILLVPGHDDEIWGAQYGNIKEANMNLALATQIYNLFKNDKRFEVHITRDESGYTKEFADYFSLHRDEILAFKEEAKKNTQNKIDSGDFIAKDGVPHNAVAEDTAVVLYGINKWADENRVDAIIHVHFNDVPRSNIWTVGKYKGFVIYVPDAQLANSRESGLLGAMIHNELSKKYITSTYEKEKGGLVMDQKLIAMGANGTLLPTVRSVLVEYGYIYRFGNNTMRHKAYNTMANFTFAGIKNYFFRK